MAKRLLVLSTVLLAPFNLSAQPSLDLRFGGHTLGEPAEVFFATARKAGKDGTTQLATEYCKSLLADARVREEGQRKDDVLKNGGVFTLQGKDLAVMDVGNCQRVMAALKGEQALVGTSLAWELGSGTAFFASGRLSALDLFSDSSYADIVLDMERRFGIPGKKDTVSRPGWPPVEELRWERNGVAAAVWKVPFSDSSVATVGFLEPPYDSHLRGTPAPESSVFSPETCKATIPSDLKKVHISSAEINGLIYHRVPPVYPESAKRSRVEGVVFLDVIIDDCGNVVESKLISGPQELVAAAIMAVKQWKFTPLALWGKEGAMEAELKVGFKLSH
jgi:TonB family protein